MNWRAAVLFLFCLPAMALDFERNDAFDYAQEAALAAVRAEALCDTHINRRGRCNPEAGHMQEARSAMIRAGAAIESFYLKCEIVYRGDMPSCDTLMGAFLARAREQMAP